ncbi:MAG: kinase-like domain-containing protein [Monoraphidium minutum]|nr:MAG: kinase-like domain-containing protein [Monoraphidium minutum]
MAAGRPPLGDGGLFDDEAPEEAVLATLADQRAIQRAPIKDVAVLRRLGEGAYAYVDLVAIGGAAPKLCAGKLLCPPPPEAAPAPPAGAAAAAAAAPCALARWTAAAAAARGPIKPTPPSMFAKQKAAYARCAGSPFVVQLLAAKSGRGGHMLLLLEWAEHGSLADRLLPDTPQHHGTLQQPEPSCDGDEGGDADDGGGGADWCDCGGGGGDGGACGDCLRLYAPAAPPPARSGGGGGGGGVPEAAARFYAGCALLALEYMHARAMVHRDVKPDNLLLFSCGYLKLSDLGACCVVPPGHAPTTRTGTAAYMAPEVKAARPQCSAADMWSLGVTVWELVAGRLPGWAGDEAGHGGGLEFPPHFSRELQSLLSRLLSRDPAARPCAEATQAAGWFSGFDWDALRERRMAPPPVPGGALA